MYSRVFVKYKLGLKFSKIIRKHLLLKMGSVLFDTSALCQKKEVTIRLKRCRLTGKFSLVISILLFNDQEDVLISIYIQQKSFVSFASDMHSDVVSISVHLL